MPCFTAVFVEEAPERRRAMALIREVMMGVM
jgi:hypothetical protein